MTSLFLVWIGRPASAPSTFKIGERCFAGLFLLFPGSSWSVSAILCHFAQKRCRNSLSLHPHLRPSVNTGRRRTRLNVARCLTSLLIFKFSGAKLGQSKRSVAHTSSVNQITQRIAAHGDPPRQKKSKILEIIRDFNRTPVICGHFRSCSQSRLNKTEQIIEISSYDLPRE